MTFCKLKTHIVAKELLVTVTVGGTLAANTLASRGNAFIILSPGNYKSCVKLASNISYLAQSRVAVIVLFTVTANAATAWGRAFFILPV
jgi:hypothetical protein